MADYRKSSVHCHSTLCDGKNTLQQMAGAACAQGLTTLGFSGHSYTKPDREYCMTPGRTAQYRATIAKLKSEYRGKVDILCGIEWDLLSEGTPKGFDYWIGSAHHLYGKNTGKYYEIDFRPEDLRDCINNDFDGDPLAAVEAYFAEVEKIAAKKPDILGHIDLIKKLNADGSFFDCKLSGADAWYIDAAPSESMPYSEMICISGVYTDPENSEDSFVYTVYLRPWGMDWEDVRTDDETRLPYFYDDWYLPLIEAGASMPNAIGGTLA